MILFARKGLELKLIFRVYQKEFPIYKWSLSIFFIIKPSELGWKLILVFTVIGFLTSITSLSVGVSEPVLSKMTEVILSMIIFYYVYNQKAYFISNNEPRFVDDEN